MKKILLVAAILAPVCLSAEEVDMTSYLQNPSFEMDDIQTLQVDALRHGYVQKNPEGWTLSGNYRVSDILTEEHTETDNNFGVFGAPADENQMYYIRNSWTPGVASLKQSIFLAAGRYRLTASSKCVTEANHSARLRAGNTSTEFTFDSVMPSNWLTTAVEFELKNDTTIQIGVDINWGGGSGASIALDNFHLYQIQGANVDPVADKKKKK